jgi:hypothetical protein
VCVCVCVWQVLGQKQNTVTKKAQTSCVFDHVMFFELKNLKKEDVQSAVIRVRSS